MSKKPVLYHAVMRNPYYSNSLRVVSVTTDKGKHIWGTDQGTHAGTHARSEDIICKFQELPDALDGMRRGNAFMPAFQNMRSDAELLRRAAYDKADQLLSSAVMSE